MKNLYGRQKQCEFKVWGSVSILLILCTIVVLFGHQAKIIEDKTAEVNTLKQLVIDKDNQIKQLTKENTQLEVQVRVALAKSTSPTLSEVGFNTLVDLLFPKQAGDRYKEIIARCENSTKDPKKVHINKNGSIDLGVSQINDRWHSERVQKIFNEDFLSAMGDSVKNMVYAALIYKDQKNFSAWTCDKSVVQR